MSDAPFFSVILSTFGRGKHIGPTIESALLQSFGDFELIVVGDGCGDETEATVRGFRSGRVRWAGLPLNSGSQSLPNNVGIRLARGKYIAYLGHDDIWAPDHLQALHTHASVGEADFVVSGCIFYGPPDSGLYFITGMFEDAEAPFHHFFPPTALAHKRDVTERVGGWKNPLIIRAPVDCDFLQRAAHAGMRFVSTRQITTHKFAAGHRYLFYLRTQSDEQGEMLQRLQKPGGVDLDTIVEESRRQGLYMSWGYQDFAVFAPGRLYEESRRNRGISRPALRPLCGREVIEQGADGRALDWYPPEQHGEGKWFRWSGPNPRPKILLPFTGGKARVAIEVVFARPGVRCVAIWADDAQVATRLDTGADGIVWLFADIPLRADDYTVPTLDAPTFRPVDPAWSEDTRRLGIGVGRIVVEPAGA